MEFSAKNPSAKKSIEHWWSIANGANWSTPLEAAAPFSKAKVLNSERVRYEIAGGNYRLVVSFKFSSQVGYVRFIGSHADYDKINALTV